MDRTIHVFWYVELYMERMIHIFWSVDVAGIAGVAGRSLGGRGGRRAEVARDTLLTLRGEGY